VSSFFLSAVVQTGDREFGRKRLQEAFRMAFSPSIQLHLVLRSPRLPWQVLSVPMNYVSLVEVIWVL
jgi:hypothetical protein